MGEKREREGREEERRGRGGGRGGEEEGREWSECESVEHIGKGAY